MRNIQCLLSKFKFPTIKRVMRPKSNADHIESGEENLDIQRFKFEKGINEVRLMGRVGNDPVASEANGKPIVQFSLAVNRAPDGIFVGGTEWHSVFTCQPAVMKHVKSFIKKGTRVYVTGRLNYVYNSCTKKTASVQLLQFIPLS